MALLATAAHERTNRAYGSHPHHGRSLHWHSFVVEVRVGDRCEAGSPLDLSVGYECAEKRLRTIRANAKDRV